MFAFSAGGDYYAVGHCEPEMVIETGNGSVTFVNDAADIPEPVSYTHLDVYKRQLLCRKAHPP